MKDRIRLMFTGEEYLYRAGLFLSVVKQKTGIFRFVGQGGLSHDYSCINIEVAADNRDNQLSWLSLCLQVVAGWEFAGPACPEIDRPSHKPHKIDYMTNLHLRGNDRWKCTDCGYEVHRTGALMDNFVSFSDFQAELRRPVTQQQVTEAMWNAVPAVIGTSMSKDKDYVRETLGVYKPYEERLGGKIDYSKPNQVGQIPRMTPLQVAKNKQEALKALGTNYETLEIATCLEMLGGSAKIPMLSDLDEFPDVGSAADHLHNNGPIFVQPKRPDDLPMICNVIRHWGQKNRSGYQPTLIVMEIDDSHVHLDKVNDVEGSVRKTARQAVKMVNFSDRYSRKVTHSDLSTIESLEKRLQDTQNQVAKKISEYLTPTEREEHLKKLCEERFVTIQNYEKWHQEHAEKTLARHSDVGKTADEMFRFLAGVNFQDHPVNEQRLFLELMSKLQKALNAFGIGREH